jgi:hypothetical protein
MTVLKEEEGEVYTVRLTGGLKAGYVEWYVGASVEPYGMVGVCVASNYEKASGQRRVGKPFSMHSCKRVPIEAVPDEILVAIAKWQLTQ